MILFSNAKTLGGHTLHLVLRLRGGGGGVEEDPTVRKYFPETWIWDTIDGKKYASIAKVPL